LKLSIVTTLYKSAEFLVEFHARAVASARAVAGEDFELVLVNDGSPDDSLAIARQLRAADPRIVIVDLSRNFGQHAAILAGLAAARGELVFLVDSDLEEPPECLEQFYPILIGQGLDVVYGLHNQSEGSWLRRTTSKGFWKLFSAISEVSIEENICHVRLMRREYVQALLSMPERNVFLGGMYAWPGFRQQSVLVDRKLRRAVSTYSFTDRVRLFARSIVAFSARPLVVVLMLGIVVSLAAIVMAAVFAIQKLIFPDSIIDGFTMMIVAILMMGGLNLFSVGLVGIYLAQLFDEVKRRPRYIVREEQRAPEAGQSDGQS
jgi:putative glycosyltransferase